MIKLGRWQHIERTTGNSKLFAANPFDLILDDFEFIWSPSNKKFFRHKTMRHLRYTRADRAVRLIRNLRIRGIDWSELK